MTTHEQALLVATTAIDFPVTEVEGRESREHIASCASCRIAAGWVAADARVIRDLPAPQPPARVTMAIVDAAHRVTVRRRQSTSADPFQPLVALAILALLVAALVGAAVAGAGIDLLAPHPDLGVIATPATTPAAVARHDGAVVARDPQPRTTPAPAGQTSDPALPGTASGPESAAPARPSTPAQAGAGGVKRTPANGGGSTARPDPAPTDPPAPPVEPTRGPTPTPILMTPSPDPLPGPGDDPPTPAPSPSMESVAERIALGRAFAVAVREPGAELVAGADAGGHAGPVGHPRADARADARAHARADTGADRDPRADARADRDPRADARTHA